MGENQNSGGNRNGGCAAKEAGIGKGARHAGEWCRFCRAKPDCAMHRAYGLTQDARLDFHGMDL